MSELETAAKPQLLKYIGLNPSSKTIGEEQAHTLSLWAFKTAIVINAASNYRRIVPKAHFQHLYDKRSLPKGVAIDVAVIDEEGPVSFYQSQMFISVGLGYEGRRAVYNIGFRIRRIMFRVFFLDGHLPDIPQCAQGRIWPYGDTVALDYSDCLDSKFDMEPATVHVE